MIISPELFQQIIFYVFATFTIGSAMAVVTVKNTIYSALFLVLCFFNTAVLWLLIEAEFLAITLVLVYVGAVMVLFLFVVMMLDVKQAKASQLKQSYTKAALLIAAAMLVQLLILFAYKLSGEIPSNELVRQEQGYSNVAEVGMTLFTQYVYPFEIAAVILLVAIVAAIMLTMRKREGNKQMDASKQININPAERLRVVSMKAEKATTQAQSKEEES
ncbi:NADH-quinone oxidoreductase subunit J [Marinicella sp. S1101]|uniref:NADH-quinone oxidoreductase subunit J n=1 Tax=Marinicella marina TaxID=2996016 RepID=UPI002260CA66|nr:NADH-quinone oxidoreductase subunit J [Marinicella marina]MCX7554120.1 NADH-quinone oxidoreductase subunit J [Marinicella marina]MDJ1141187.1 NADH-quinone oxidoreductase subunit J [Marinicella marina]